MIDKINECFFFHLRTKTSHINILHEEVFFIVFKKAFSNTVEFFLDGHMIQSGQLYKTGTFVPRTVVLGTNLGFLDSG